MRFVIAVAWASALILSFPRISSAQRVELPTMTPEQRWDRASKNLTLFTAMFIREGTQAGKTPGEVGRELARFFGPWPVETPGDLARTIYRNWQLWRDVEFLAEQDAVGTVTVTTNRPYIAALEQYKLIGVTPDVFDAMFAAFHEAIAHQKGLSFEQIVSSDSVRMTIRRVE